MLNSTVLRAGDAGESVRHRRGRRNWSGVRSCLADTCYGIPRGNRDENGGRPRAARFFKASRTKNKGPGREEFQWSNPAGAFWLSPGNFIFPSIFPSIFHHPFSHLPPGFGMPSALFPSSISCGIHTSFPSGALRLLAAGMLIRILSKKLSCSVETRDHRCRYRSHIGWQA